MGFQVEPTGLRPRHPRLGIAAAVLIGAAIVGLGLATKPALGPDSAAPSSNGAVAGTRTPSAAATSIGAPLASAVPAVGASPSAQARPLPTALDCHDVTRAVCTEAATAALGVLPGDLPPVSGATVWDSLVCSILPDCPPQLLTRDAVPLGSVIVTFIDAGPEAWINVVAHQPAPSGSAPLPATAWIVRWH